MEKNKTQKLYRQVAQQILSLIQQGVLPMGKKVPSLRILSRQLGVSLSTVIHAYQILENQNVLKSRPQSGYFVNEKAPLFGREPEGEAAPGPMQVTSAKSLNAKIQSMDPFISAMTDPKNLFLSIGFPGLSVLSAPSLRRSLKRGAWKAGAEALSYNSSQGSLALRQQLARHYLDRGVGVSPDQIVLTAGGSESLNVCYRLVGGDGGIIAVESPMAALLPICLQYHGFKILEIPMRPGEGMDLEFLKKSLRRYRIKACITMPNFHNPTGISMPDENKRRLVEMLAERDIALIENDVYGDLWFGKQPPKPVKAFDQTGNVILCSSFSKSVAPGLRVGWILGGKFTDKLSQARFMGNASTNPLVEAGMVDFMESGEYARQLRKVRKFCESNLRVYTQAILKYFPEGTRVSRPSGGLLFWVEFPRRVDASKLQKEALAKNVLILPGPFFTLVPKYKNYVSISFGHQWSESIEKTLEWVGHLAKKQLAPKQ
ncbi:MAG TPA: PLP-dependent aminotransferase family protein [bacterium]|nr:PLP-dependent aminotransferase family protein [bacterium]